jgi:hemolysin activation/secretion protein
VRQILVTGSTVFSEQELATVTAPFINRTVTSEDLEALRLTLTRLYIDNGYINSGAILPDQTVTDGVMRFDIIEGELTSVTVTGNRWFRAGYLRKRLTLDVEPPLNIGTLQTRLQHLQQDERIERLNAELRPGVRPGESELHVQVEEHVPFYVALEVNNYQAPPIGAERGLLTVAHRNLTGHGDVFSFTFGRSAGLELQIDTSYTLPLNARDTTVSARYQQNGSSVVQASLADLDIESREEIYTLTVRHPFYSTLRREFALALSAEHLESKTFLSGQPFDFSLGSENGKTNDTALRFSQEWLDRTQNQVLAIRSRFSLGLDALDATIHNDSAIPDGRFFVWLGQFQWARRLSAQDIQFLFRLDVQLTPDPLLPLEQIAIGGRYSVRGYRENEIIRDNGLIASVESRIPLIRNKRWAEFVQVVPFVDAGGGWNSRVPTPDPHILLGVGLGVRWAATLYAALPLRSSFEVFWGYRVIHVKTEGDGDSLQDHGISLQFVIAAF